MFKYANIMFYLCIVVGVFGNFTSSYLMKVNFPDSGYSWKFLVLGLFFIVLAYFWAKIDEKQRKEKDKD